VLRVAQEMNWSKNATTHKVLVLIGDDVPHPPSWTNLNLNWREEAQKLKQIGVKIYAVQALSNRHAKPFYSELANITKGVYINFKHFAIISGIPIFFCFPPKS
jgi:hypothetical protein